MISASTSRLICRRRLMYRGPENRRAHKDAQRGAARRQHRRRVRIVGDAVDPLQTRLRLRLSRAPGALRPADEVGAPCTIATGCRRALASRVARRASPDRSCARGNAPAPDTSRQSTPACGVERGRFGVAGERAFPAPPRVGDVRQPRRATPARHAARVAPPTLRPRNAATHRGAARRRRGRTSRDRRGAPGTVRAAATRARRRDGAPRTPPRASRPTNRRRRASARCQDARAAPRCPRSAHRCGCARSRRAACCVRSRAGRTSTMR